MADNKVEIKITADASGLAKGAAVATTALSGLEKQLISLSVLSSKAFSAAGFIGFAGAATAAAGALMATVKAAADYGDQLDNMSQRTGVAVEDLAKLQYAAKLSDTSTEALGKGITNLSRLMVGAANGAAESSKLFEKYGIEVRNTDGSVRSTIDVMADLADIFTTMPDGAEKTALAAEFFGKKLGVELIPMLNAGSDGLKKLADEAERLGLVLTSSQAKAAAEFNDNLDRMAARSKSLAVAIGNELIPAVNKLLGQMEDARGSKLSFWQMLWTGNPKDGEEIARLKEAQAELDKLKQKRDALLADNKRRGVDVSDFKAYDAEIAAAERMVAYRQAQAKRVIGDQEDLDKKRELLAKQLSGKLVELEKLRGIASGKISADILKDDKARTEEQLKNAEKLRDALKAAWDTSRKEAEKAGDEAEKLLDKAAGIRLGAGDKANAIREKDLPEEERQMLDQMRAIDARDQGAYAAARAGVALLDGRGKDFEKYQKDAENFLDRAMKFAESAGDPNLIEEVGNQQAQLVESQAKAKQKEQADLTSRAEAQMTLINELDAKVRELQNQAVNIEIKADVTNAENDIANLTKQLAELAKGVTVPVSMASSGALPAAPAVDTSGDTYQWASGGWTGPGGKYKVAGLVHAGEFVHRQEVVRQPGALEFLARFNRIGMAALRGYSGGGLVERLSMPSIAANSGSFAGPSKNLTLVLDGQRFGVSATSDVIGRIEDHVAREALRKGRR